MNDQLSAKDWLDQGLKALASRGFTALKAEPLAKALHVSPFLGMDHDYRVRWTEPGDHVGLSIEVTAGGATVFTASLTARRTPLTRRRAIALLGRYPLLTLRVSASIYAHALRNDLGDL